MKILKKEDINYPENLNKIKNPPKVLYVLGNIGNLNKKGIAIIGSRVCTPEGAKIAREFAFELSKMGICIISGMAKGIDSEAHIGALKAGGATIAVLGSGFKHIYPEENKELFNDIIKNNGTVITEYLEDTEVCSKGFVQRNRIVSGLSEGVFIVEAKHRSGTAITAEFAKTQKKPIFCIPHNIGQKEGIGTNRILQNNGILVTMPEDIIKYLKIKTKSTLNKKQKEISSYIPVEYREVYECIKNKETNIDEICRKLKKDISKINYELTMLEIGGYICSLPGKNFKRI